MDDSAMKKLEDTIAVAKFAPKKPDVNANPSVDVLLEEMAELQRRLDECTRQLRDAWSSVANSALNITRAISK